jgi:hypothetical protein
MNVLKFHFECVNIVWFSYVFFFSHMFCYVVVPFYDTFYKFM